MINRINHLYPKLVAMALLFFICLVLAFSIQTATSKPLFSTNNPKRTTFLVETTNKEFDTTLKTTYTRTPSTLRTTLAYLTTKDWLTTGRPSTATKQTTMYPTIKISTGKPQNNNQIINNFINFNKNIIKFLGKVNINLNIN